MDFVIRKIRNSGALDQRRRNGLADVARGVFGSMKEQPEDGRREAGAAHLAVFEERFARR